jgi:hypothetical protein
VGGAAERRRLPGRHNLKHASQIYGFFAIVLGMLSWLYLAAQATLYAAEVSVVRARRLWPRSLLQPPSPTQTDSPGRPRQARGRRPEESIHVDFTDQPTTAEHQPQDHNPQ